MVKEEFNDTTRIFNYWNNLEIITHRKLTDDIKNAIKRALKDYDIAEIQTAMFNYGVILKDEAYYFKYYWTISEFLTRHKCNNIERFLDLEIAKSNFKRDSNAKDKQNGLSGNKPNGAFSGL